MVCRRAVAAGALRVVRRVAAHGLRARARALRLRGRAARARAARPRPRPRPRHARHALQR